MPSAEMTSVVPRSVAVAETPVAVATAPEVVSIPVIIDPGVTEIVGTDGEREIAPSLDVLVSFSPEADVLLDWLTEGAFEMDGKMLGGGTSGSPDG